jgi:hypothetical protein
MDKIIELAQMLFAELEAGGFDTKTENKGQRTIHVFSYDDGYMQIDCGSNGNITVFGDGEIDANGKKVEEG